MILCLAMLLQVSPLCALAYSGETQSNINTLGKYYTVSFTDGRTGDVLDERFYSHRKPQEIGEFPEPDIGDDEFLGWFCGSEEVFADTKVHKDMEITAVFAEKPFLNEFDLSEDGTYMRFGISGLAHVSPEICKAETGRLEDCDILEAFRVENAEEADTLNIRMELLAKPDAGSYDGLWFVAISGDQVSVLESEAGIGSVYTADAVGAADSCFALVGIPYDEPEVSFQEIPFITGSGDSVILEGWLPVSRAVEIEETEAPASVKDMADGLAGTYRLNIEGGWIPEVPVSVMVISSRIAELTETGMELFVVRTDREGNSDDIAVTEDGQNFVTFSMADCSDYSVVGRKPSEIMFCRNGDIDIAVRSVSENAEISETAVVEAEDGLEIIGAYSVSGEKVARKSADLSMKVAVKSVSALKSRESMAVYAIRDGRLAELLAENAEDFDIDVDCSGIDGFAVVKDTGFRKKDAAVSPADGETVKLSGMMPKDAGVSVSIVDDRFMQGYEVLAAYDISILEDGDEYQPEEGKPVEVEISGVRMQDNADIHVFHVLKDGTKQEVQDVTVDEEKTVRFSATGFSVYIIEDHEGQEHPTTPRKIFHFLEGSYTDHQGSYEAGHYTFQNMHGDMVSTQKVKNGEVLVLIPNPPDYEYEGGEYQFYGWYVVQASDVDDNGTPNNYNDDTVTYQWLNPVRQEFSTPITVTGPDDEHVFLAPLYANQRFVTFHEDSIWKCLDETNDIWGPGARAGKILTRKMVTFDQSGSVDILISDIYVPQPDATHEFYYCWQTVERYADDVNKTGEPLDYTYYIPTNTGYDIVTYVNKTVTNTQHITRQDANMYISVSNDTDSVDLYPIFRKANWLYFVAGPVGSGASFVNAEIVWTDDSFTELPVSSRYNYTFDGWYYYPDLGTQDPEYDADGNVINGGSTTETITTHYLSRYNTQGSAEYTGTIYDANSNVVTNPQYPTTYYRSTRARNPLYWLTRTETVTVPTGIQVTDGDGTVLPSADNVTGITVTDGAMKITEDIVLYGHWTPETDTSYTVVVWRQKVTDAVGLPEASKSYDYVDSFVYPAHTGVFPSATTQESYSTTSGDYRGFVYGRTERTSQTVLADGSTVVNVYYDRNQYILTFQVQQYLYTETTSNTGTQYGIVNNEYARVYYVNGEWRTSNSANGTVYTGTRFTRGGTNSWRAVKTIVALYDQNISSNFPVVTDQGIRYDNGERWDPQTNNVGLSEVMVYLNTMPAGNVTFRLNIASKPLKTLNYYVEALPGVTPELTYDGTGYVLYTTVGGRYGYVSEAEDFFEITGYTKNGSDPAYVNGRALTNANADESINMFYLRKSYEIVFDTQIPQGELVENGGENENQDRTVTVLFEAPISQYGNGAEPTRAHYTFTGWYADPACSTYVFFSDPAPEDFWNPDGTNKLWAKDSNGDYINTDANNTVHQMMPYTVLGDSLNETSDRFMPSNNILLYAGWEPVWYKITLEANGGEILRSQSRATYFWKQWGSTFDEYKITRPYVPNVNGDYIYAESEQMREAKYIPVSEFGNVAAGEYGTGAGYESYVRLDNEYYEQDVTHFYTLLGWFEVLYPGTQYERLAPATYSFTDIVQNDITLRAVWRAGGTFIIAYNGTYQEPGTNEVIVAGTAPQAFDPENGN